MALIEKSCIYFLVIEGLFPTCQLILAFSYVEIKFPVTKYGTVVLYVTHVRYSRANQLRNYSNRFLSTDNFYAEDCKQ